MYLLLHLSRGEEYCDQPVCLCVCLSVSVSLERLDRASQTFVCRSPMAVAWSSSGGIVLCYVLRDLWMTSRLAIMGHTVLRGRPDLLLLSGACVTGVESDVYECLFI